MKNLEAFVRHIKEGSWSGFGQMRDGLPVNAQQFLLPVRVVIQKEGELYFSYLFDINGNSAGDVCNLSLADAQEGAEQNYGIALTDWRETDEGISE